MVTAGRYLIDPLHTRVQFAVLHMGFSEYYGDFTGAIGSLTLNPQDIEASAVEVNLPAASVTTTNQTLDAELRSSLFFDAERHTSVIFKSTRVTRAGPTSATIAGELTFHGVTKPVTLEASFTGAGVNPLDHSHTVGFTATTKFKRSDFGVKAYIPLVGDSVTLRISAAFVRPGD